MTPHILLYQPDKTIWGKDIDLSFSIIGKNGWYKIESFLYNFDIGVIQTYIYEYEFRIIFLLDSTWVTLSLKSLTPLQTCTEYRTPINVSLLW